MPKLNRAIATLQLSVLVAVSWFAPVTGAAQAQPALRPLAAAITTDPGITCLDSAELVEHVSSWLGSDSISEPLAIEVHGSPYFARTVWFRIQRGDTTVAERRFEPAPARCDDLHAAVGLAIALALKASLLDSFVDVVGHARVKRPFRLELQALGGVAIIPGADFGLGMSLQYAITDRFAARLGVLGLLGPYGDFEEDQGRFKTWLSIGRLDVCSRIAELRSLSVSVCVGIAAGALNATGEAFPETRDALIPYLGVANALELDIALGERWSLAVAIDVLVPVRRTSFVVRDQLGTVLATHELATAGALIAVGPAFHF